MYWCVSYYDGDVSWLNDFSEGNYHVYLKDVKVPDGIDIEKTTTIDNVGYNIYSYMKFIVDNYDHLPELTVFCKNNTFPRHVSKEVFSRLTSRKIFTPIEDISRYKLEYPVSMLSCNNGFMELNTSWWTSHHPVKYFHNFYDFWMFIFDVKSFPRYVRFAPGANYVVPRENILLRSKSFYENLMNFVSHDLFSGESHMVERALYAIWTSILSESNNMTHLIDDHKLDALSLNVSQKRNNKMKIYWEKLIIRIYIILNKIAGFLFSKFYKVD